MTMTFEGLKGRVMDLDSHEQIPVARYGDVFGEAGRRSLQLRAAAAAGGGEPVVDRRTITARYPFDPGPDVVEITPENVWEYKGPVAPGASDFSRRTAVLDVMGIHRQLIFPGFALSAIGQAEGGGNALQQGATQEEMDFGRVAIAAHNEWAADIVAKYGDRLRVVGLVASGREGLTPEGLIEDAERVIDMGLPAVMMSSGRPPAGRSPADKALDPFYALLAESNVPLIFHAGCGTGFRRSNVWEQAAQFGQGDYQDKIPGQIADECEMHAGPSVIMNVYLPEQNFLSLMVLGGVLERHPTLRVGAIEMGSSWLGPMAERMDYLTDHQRHHPWFGGKELSLRPSEYVNRQIRVTPYVFEPVEKYVERWPEVQDTYCYTTDYPHFEGNKYSMKRFYDQLAPLGDDFLEKYFVTNGELIVP